MCQKGLFKAIKYFGSQQALAKTIGVTQQTVSHWLNREQKIPDVYALQLFIQTKGYISLQELVSSPQAIYQMLEKVHFFLKFPAISVPIKAIQVQDFICPKYTDRDSTLIDLDNALLSHPILMDTQYQLISCECRLRAHKLLGNHTILAHSINLRDVIQGDFSLASLIQTFPISEKAAIGLAIERELGNRQGKRKDLPLVDTDPQVMLGTKTRHVAARLAGFKSDFLYRQVKVVLQQGSSSLIHAMDEQTCSIAQAKKIALLSQQQQHLILANMLDSVETASISS